MNKEEEEEDGSDTSGYEDSHSESDVLPVVLSLASSDQSYLDNERDKDETGSHHDESHENEISGNSSSNHSNELSSNLPTESHHTMQSQSSSASSHQPILGKVSMPPWISQMKQTKQKQSGGEPSSQPQRMNSLSAPNINTSTWNSSLDRISNHDTTKQIGTAADTSSSSFQSSPIHTLFIYRLGGSTTASRGNTLPIVSNHSTKPLCLAKYDQPSSIIIDDTTTTTNSNNNNTLESIVTKLIQATPPKQSNFSDGHSNGATISEQQQQGLMGFQVRPLSKHNSNHNNHSNPQVVVYGASSSKITGTKPLCCAVVVDKEYPFDTAVALLQETFHEFTKLHSSYIIQRDNTQEYALSYPSKALLRTLLDAYQDPIKATTRHQKQQQQQQQGLQHPSTLNAAQLLSRDSSSRRANSMLGTTDSSSNNDDENSFSDSNNNNIKSDHTNGSIMAKKQQFEKTPASVKSTAPWMMMNRHKPNTIQKTATQQDDMEEERIHDKDDNIKMGSDPASLHQQPKPVQRKDSKIEVVVTVPWDSRTPSDRALSKNVSTSLRSLAKKMDEPTITTRTNTTVASGMTTTQEEDRNDNQSTTTVHQQQLHHQNPQPIPATPRSILLQENKNSSIQSTLGGSMNGEEYDDNDDDNTLDKDIAAKNIPIWAKARENLRSTPKVERPKKHSSLPVATKEDLRPTPSVEKTNTSDAKTFHSEVLLRPTTPKTNHKGRETTSGTLPSPSPPPPPPESPMAESMMERTDKPSTDEAGASTEALGKKLAITPSPHTKGALHEGYSNKKTMVFSTQNDESTTKRSSSRASCRSPYVADVPPERKHALGADETLRKPTISQYDNWELVKAHYLPSLDPESLDASTLTCGDTSMDNDVVSVKSSSAASDWGVPTRNQNADDSSWVNPARPIDPERREQIKSEVDRTFLQRLDQVRMQPLLPAKQLGPDPMPVVMEVADDRLEPDCEKSPMDDLVTLAVTMAQPGSYDEEQGWVPVVKSVSKQSPSKDSVLELDESDTWKMPSTTTAACPIIRKPEDHEKDYRYTYITARPISSQQNAAAPVASYWDKVRHNYFQDREVPIPTEGPRISSVDSISRPSWRDGGDQSVESGSWLPPSGIDTNSRCETTRSVPIGCDPPVRGTPASTVEPAKTTRSSMQRGVDQTRPDLLPSFSSYPSDGGDKSVVTSDSDWQPPSRMTRMHRIDFTGRITSTKDDVPNENNSIRSRCSSSTSSDKIPWVPKAEEIICVDTTVSTNKSDERRRPSSGLPSFPSQASNQDNIHNKTTVSSSSINDSGWESGSDVSVEHDDVASSVWTSDLRLGDGDDCNIEQNISGHSDIQTVKLELAQAEREQFQRKRQSQGRTIVERPTLGQKMSPGVSSNDSSSASFDSIMSYTGRISFKTSPEIITFEDGPNEDRGTHYSQYGQSEKDVSHSMKKKKSSSSNVGQRDDPCIYYTLCCLMIALPAAILMVMFLFVIDLDGDNSNTTNSTTDANVTTIG
ncbi:hypothetical protein IV203_028402 [Nitzschia inconspicua]|uniref:Uncharacterized protein n=1 Tax=Nitzschia inconspicua TaxID=303405 RepID=A0A9K3LPJ0_9STRA|nr:hypothetical protein IV203_028402 [Nitzschia inconspicua]